MRSLFLLLTLVPTLVLATPASKPVSKTPDPLWDHWYSISDVSLKKPATYGVYHEKFVAEPDKDRVHLEVSIWKKEKDFVNQENIGGYSKNDNDLTPLFYHFRSLFQQAETLVETEMGPAQLLAKVTLPGMADKKEFKVRYSGKAVFTSFFPLWLNRNAESFKKNTKLQFKAFLEDGLQNRFEAVHGSVKRESEKSLRISFGGQESVWTLDLKNVPEKIEFLAVKNVATRVTEKEGKEILKSLQAK